MVIYLRFRCIGVRVCSLLGAIDRQGLWSSRFVKAGYRLLPACRVVFVGIVIGVIVSAINISSVGRGLCLVIGLLLVLSLLLGSCNVAASAFCGQPEGRRLTNPILTLHRHSKQQTYSEYNRHTEMCFQMSTELRSRRQYRHEQGLRTSPHFPTPLSEAAATNCVPLRPLDTFHLHQTSSCRSPTLRHQ